MTGKHIHGDGTHTHNELLPDKLGKEGIKLIIKGDLKNLPNISFKKKKPRKPRDNTKKKDDLEKLVKTIESKIKDFEGKKQIVERVISSGGTIQQVPVYIPQFSVPEKPSKDDLNNIINDVFGAENNLRQYYEQTTNQPFIEIEEIFDNEEEAPDLPNEDPPPPRLEEPDLPIEDPEPQRIEEDLPIEEEAPQRIEEDLPIEEEEEAPQRIEEDLPPLAPRLQPTPLSVEQWEEIPNLNIPSATFENVSRPIISEDTGRSLLDSVQDIIDNNENSILSWFNTPKPRNLVLKQSETEFDDYKKMNPSKLVQQERIDEYENISQFQLTTEEEAQLQIEREKETEAIQLRENFRDLGITHNLGSNANIRKLDRLREQLGNDIFIPIANSIYENLGRKVRVTAFYNAMIRELDRLNEVAEFQRQREAERESEREAAAAEGADFQQRNETTDAPKRKKKIVFRKNETADFQQRNETADAPKRKKKIVFKKKDDPAPKRKKKN